jgi:hypothetical protein
MSSKSSRSLNKRRGNLGLGTPRRKIRERESPTHRKKDISNMEILKKTSLSYKKIRKLEG